MTRCVAIVDPYSSGRLLAERLHDNGANCIAIKSSREVPPIFRRNLKKHCFDEILEDGGNLAVMLRRQYGANLTHVMAGCESGVELSDRLSENLGLPSNGVALSSARRDKFLMSEAVRKSGLQTAGVFRSKNPHELKNWATSRNFWPVVVKPISSVASDDVHLCESGDDVLGAAAEIIGKKNVLGIVNQEALLQDYLEGQEYVVDSVSLDGHHKVTAFWAYRKDRRRTRSTGYDAMTLLPYNGQRQEALARYAVGVLDALGIRFGPAHCELMWCGAGPVLVEVGARLSAGLNAELSEICGCLSQLGETVKTVLDPKEFYDTGKDLKILKKHAANVFFHREKQGRLRSVRRENELRQLKTLYRLSLGAKAGELLPPVLGMVTLVHKDLSEVEKDIEEIRALEEDGLFDVEEI